MTLARKAILARQVRLAILVQPVTLDRQDRPGLQVTLVQPVTLVRQAFKVTLVQPVTQAQRVLKATLDQPVSKVTQARPVSRAKG